MQRSILSVAFAVLFGIFGASGAWAQTRGDLKCESWNYQAARCNVANIVDAQVTSVIAGQCYQGRSWGWDRGGIWVNNGCRAKFRYQTGYDDYRGGNGGGYSGGGNRNSTIIKCESWNYKDARCAVDTRGGVELSNQIAGNCQQGRTWGFDRGGIWVSGGCRAEFRVYAGYAGGGHGDGWAGQGENYKVKCLSINYQPARCPASIRTGVRLTKTIGGECIYNRTWGWDRGGIWVNGGCRGEFMVDG